MICHNEIQDKLVDLASKAFSPSAVCDEQKSFHVALRKELADGKQETPVKCLFYVDRREDRGDVLI
jgi:hypothetical protein